MNISDNIKSIKQQLPEHVTLVVVSKTRTEEEITVAYEAGQRDFGENRVQELMAKQPELPDDIRWHLIGHLQRNKVKYVVPFVHLIHSVDSLRLLKEINKQATKHERVIPCLLQVHIAREETKYGLSPEELHDLLQSDEHHKLKNIKVTGLMGMATFTDNRDQIAREFASLQQLYNSLKDTYHFDTLSMGMSSDYDIAVKHGSTMVRVGSAVFK